MPSFVDISKGVNDRLLTLRLHLTGSRCVTIVSVYASTLDSNDVVMAQFYESLRTVLNSVPGKRLSFSMSSTSVLVQIGKT